LHGNLRAGRVSLPREYTAGTAKGTHALVGVRAPAMVPDA